MSMSTHVVGFRPPSDEMWKRMKKVYDSCKDAGIDPPEAVTEFFGDQDPDPAGVEVDIKQAVSDWQDESREGFEVDLSKLPSNVTKLRFYNSY